MINPRSIQYISDNQNDRKDIEELSTQRTETTTPQSSLQDCNIDLPSSHPLDPNAYQTHYIMDDELVNVSAFSRANVIAIMFVGFPAMSNLLICGLNPSIK